MLHAYNKLPTLSFSNNYNPDWIYNGEKTARINLSCVLEACFVSHRFNDPLSSIPESGKGRGESPSMDPFNGDLKRPTQKANS